MEEEEAGARRGDAEARRGDGLDKVDALGECCGREGPDKSGGPASSAVDDPCETEGGCRDDVLPGTEQDTRAVRL